MATATVNVDRIVERLLQLGTCENEEAVFTQEGLDGLKAFNAPNFLVIETTEKSCLRRVSGLLSSRCGIG
jgi:hypothetical protein